MKISCEMTDSILIVRLEGELDHHEAASVRETIDKTIEAFATIDLVFCFRDLSFMDSAGIGVIMGRYNKVKGKAGQVCVAECGAYVARILEMAGIYTITKQFATTEGAITYCKELQKEREREKEKEEEEQ